MHDIASPIAANARTLSTAFKPISSWNGTIVTLKKFRPRKSWKESKKGRKWVMIAPYSQGAENEGYSYPRVSPVSNLRIYIFFGSSPNREGDFRGFSVGRHVRWETRDAPPGRSVFRSPFHPLDREKSLFFNLKSASLVICGKFS